MNYNLQERFNQADAIFISKGENRSTVEMALAAQGTQVADIDGVNPRCLHGSDRW
jgi:hypothetical protein